MKKILLALLISLIVCTSKQVKEESVKSACVTIPEKAEKKCDNDFKNKISKAIVKDNNGNVVLELDPDEFEVIFGYAEKYINFLKLTKDEKALKKSIEVVKMSESTYAVKVKLNNDIMITATVLINNEELNNLRAKAKRLHEEQPVVETTRLSDTTFKISMSVDDVKWTTIVDVESVKHRFDWVSYWMGVATAALAGLGLAIKTKLVLLFFLL